MEQYPHRVSERSPEHQPRLPEPGIPDPSLQDVCALRTMEDVWYGNSTWELGQNPLTAWAGQELLTRRHSEPLNHVLLRHVCGLCLLREVESEPGPYLGLLA